MNSQERPFLDFYGRHSIIPTELVIPDEKMFFKQRDFLFQSLGIPPNLLRGKTIFELGPGNGQKLKHLLSLEPASYTAVDANPASLEATNRVIQASGFRGPTAVFECDILEYSSDETYDLVLAELVIPSQLFPDAIVNKLFSFSKIGGLLITTCTDFISLLSETLRKIIVTDLRLISDNLDKSATDIANFYAEDLSSLAGMNRKPKDWVLDQLIKPAIGKPFSIPDTLKNASSTVSFNGSSPRFFRDFRWYKEPTISARSTLDLVETNYWETVHSLIDMRIAPTYRIAKENVRIFDVCESLYIYSTMNSFSNTTRHQITSIVRRLEVLVSEFSPVTANSIDAFLNFWESGDIAHLDTFRPWWGRGSQYISLMKD